MKLFSTLSMLLVTFICSSQEKEYTATVFTKLGDSKTGTITVNLDGPNVELLPITVSEKSKNKSGGSKSKQATTTTTSLNYAFIHHIVIGEATYYFRDIKYDYNDKYYRNVCVRLLAGDLECGVFQNGLSSGDQNISVKLPNDEFSKLVAVDFDYYKVTSGWHLMAFGKCASLREKMKNESAGYSWDDNTTSADRIKMWKIWVSEYNSCKMDD